MAADLEAVRQEALRLVRDAPDGEGLSDWNAAIIDYGLAASPTCLDADVLSTTTDLALAAGLDEAMLVEILLLVAAVGMHTLHEGILELRRRSEPPQSHTAELHVARELGKSYWKTFDAELPGFLDGIARWSPDGYQAFMNFCATPVRTGRLSRLDRELLWLAIDAAPTHRYVPGLRFHIGCALRVGATRKQIVETVERAALGADHTGVARHRGPEGAGPRV